MKGKVIGVFVLAFTVFLMFQGTSAQAASLDQWDIIKEYTLEQNSVRYHAYLTKDKKESWIYKAELMDKKKMLDVTFPSKIEGVPVT